MRFFRRRLKAGQHTEGLYEWTLTRCRGILLAQSPAETLCHGEAILIRPDKILLRDEVGQKKNFFAFCRDLKYKTGCNPGHILSVPL